MNQTTVNEVLFPAGCSLAIYAADAIGEHSSARPARSANG